MNRWFPVLLAGLAIAVLLALGVGSTTHGPSQVLALLTGGGNAQELDALWQVRLPRVLVGIGAGAALAVAGMLLQTVLRNPLADSGLLGINAGGGLAMVALLATYPARSAAPPWLLPVAAAGGALATATLVLALAWRAGGVAPLRLLLVGLAVAASAGAAMLALSLAVDPALLRFVVAWQAGTLSGRDLDAALLVLPAAGGGGLLTWLLAPRFDLLALDDETAISLGLRPDRLRMLAVVIAALLAAAVVSVAGALGFIGLLAPGIARALVGHGLRRQIPAALLAGATIVVAADAAARTIVAPIELPTGILVAVVGGPVLLITLIRRSRP